MKDEEGKTLTDKQILKDAMDQLANVCCLLYETQDPQYHPIAFMADSTLKLAFTIYNEDNILSASADFSAYENEVYQRNKIKVIK